ncbi:MAG: SDR family NAD(P)-dependent oxidoreductase [Verrucomicrobiota bacterium]
MEKPVAIITGGEGDLAGALAGELQPRGFRILAPGRHEMDVRSSSSVEDWFSPIERVDLLINNAGVTRDTLVPRLSANDWDEVISTNLKGAQLCSQAAARIMIRQRRGHIVNIGSYAGDHPSPGQAAYAASKAGLVGLTKSLARELGKRNVRINCVLPGFLETRMTAEVSDLAREAALSKHELGRFNTVGEAARFVAFLATTENVSGQVFQLDSRV